jgi:acyl CoA:acetate/3-ketoacid CoA transferase alpha subunit
MTATPRDKRCTEAEAVAELRSGMTIGFGGWGSRRKPMSVVREILRSDVTDLTVVSWGGPDVGLLCAAGRVRRVLYAFVSLDTIPLEPHFRAARQSGRHRGRALRRGHVPPRPAGRVLAGAVPAHPGGPGLGPVP